MLFFAISQSSQLICFIPTSPYTRSNVDELQSAMTNRGWDTFGAYAFSCVYTPQSQYDRNFIENVLNKLVPVADGQSAHTERHVTGLTAHTYSCSARHTHAASTSSVEVRPQLCAGALAVL